MSAVNSSPESRSLIEYSEYQAAWRGDSDRQRNYLGDAKNADYETARFTGRVEHFLDTSRSDANIAWLRYVECCQANTGAVQDAEFRERKKRERKVLRDQSYEIAQKLELAGIQGFTDDSYGVFKVGICSGHDNRQPNFRPINFLPAHAAQKRGKMLQHLECWLSKHPYARFWTFTNGERCTVSQLRARLRKLHRMISNLNAEPWFSDVAQIVFRSSELGSLIDLSGEEKRNSDDEWLYHPHSHVIVVLKNGPLKKAQWSAFLSRVWGYVGHQFDDASVLGKVREAVKYVTKPGDVCAHSPDELKELYYALFRCNLVSPMGQFREFRERLKDKKLDVERVATDDGFRWREVPSVNAHRKHEDEHDDESEDVTEISDEKELEDGGKFGKIVAYVRPHPNDLGVSEPYVMVRGLRGSAREFIDAHPSLRRLRDTCMESYEVGVEVAGISEDISVHTTTLSAGNPAADQGEFCLNPVPKVKPPPKVPDCYRKDDPEVVNALDFELAWMDGTLAQGELLGDLRDYSKLGGDYHVE